MTALFRIAPVIALGLLAACSESEEQVAAKKLGLSVPLAEVQFSLIRDGGSRAVTFTDADGRTLTLVVYRPGPRGQKDAHHGTVFARRGGPDELLVEPGSGQARAAARLVDAWLSRTFPEEERNSLWEWFLETRHLRNPDDGPEQAQRRQLALDGTMMALYLERYEDVGPAAFGAIAEDLGFAEEDSGGSGPAQP